MIKDKFVPVSMTNLQIAWIAWNCMTCLCQKSSNTGAYLQMQMIVIWNENETVSPIGEVMSTKSPRKPQIVLSCVGWWFDIFSCDLMRGHQVLSLLSPQSMQLHTLMGGGHTQDQCLLHKIDILIFSFFISKVTDERGRLIFVQNNTFSHLNVLTFHNLFVDCKNKSDYGF